MSSRTAERAGSARSGASASTRSAETLFGAGCAGLTAPSMPRRGPRTNPEARGDRHGRGGLQRALRRRRRSGHRAAAGALARLRRAPATGTSLAAIVFIAASPRSPGRSTATCTCATACSSASRPSAACSLGTWLQQRVPLDASRCCSRSCSSRAPSSWCCVIERGARRARRRRRRRHARRRRRHPVRARPDHRWASARSRPRRRRCWRSSPSRSSAPGASIATATCAVKTRR